MADIQKQLIDFDKEIRLGRFEESATLRDKKDKVLSKLKSNFKNQFTEGETIPTYTTFNQGSYKLGTGVVPKNGDYDIDVGIVFDLSVDDYKAFDVKEWIRKSLHNHTNHVKNLKPCVRVQYQIDDEPVYHVDLAIYIEKDGKVSLARGTDSENAFWENADPYGLIDIIENCQYESDDKDQFRRVIRFLKRWKENVFTSVNGKPTGIALTLCAYKWFNPVYEKDRVSLIKKYDDLSALINLLESIFLAFSKTYNYEEQEYKYSIVLNKPTAPFDNIFSKMSLKQMETLYDKIESLKKALQNAKNEIDPHEACNIIKKALKDDADFPVPTKAEAARRNNPVIIQPTQSA